MFQTHPLISSIERSLSLTEAEQVAVAGVPIRFATLEANQDVVREGDRPSRCVLVINGVLATSKVSLAGKRQITALHIAGDMPDLLTLYLELLDSDIRTITRAEVAFIDHAGIHRLCAEHPRIAAVLWRATLVDAAIFREWVVNVGQRLAISRMAHLFCEMMARMEFMGLAEDNHCGLPLTQNQLSEATGLSVVHVNRTLQALRGRQLIELGGGKLIIHDWDALCELGEFRADYLHRARRVPVLVQ